MRIPLFSLLSGLLICSAWADEVTLMLNPADRARPTWQRLSEEFNRTHAGIRFRIIWSDVDAKMHLLAAADALPDLLILPDFQLVKYHSLLADLGPFVDSLPEVRGQIYPSLLGACEYGGALKLLPVYFNIPFVYYRPDLFREAGLPMPDERWTWDDYSRAAKALTRRAPDGSVKTFGTNLPLLWWVGWLSFVRQAGGDLVDSEGNLQIGKPATLRALELMHDFVHADGSAPLPANAPPGAFINGRYAMFYGGHVSELATLREHADFEWDIAPLPAGPAGRATGELAVVGVGIWKGTKHPQAAREVLRFLSRKASEEALCKAGLLPVRKDVAREVLLAGTPETRTAPPKHIDVLIDSLAFASSVPKLRFFAPLAQSCIQPLIIGAVTDPDRGKLAGLPAEMDFQARNYLKTLEEKPRENPVLFLVQAGVIALVAGWFLVRFLWRTPVTADEWRAGKRFFLFAAPCLLGMAVFVIGPLGISFWWAQTDYDLVSPARYVGWGQYATLLFQDPDFWHSLKLSLIFAVCAVPVGLAASLGAALLLNQNLPGIGIFRAVFYLPSILPVAASGILWLWFLHPRFGLVNRLLGLLGLPGPGWLQDPQWALPSVVLISAWGFGGAMLIFLAGLKNIPDSLYEAAEIDGAGALKRFVHITLPSLAPIIFFNLTMGIIGALQVFDLAYIVSTMGGGGTDIGGPQKSLYFYVLNLYEKSFIHLNIGVGSAMAWIFFVVILGITALNFLARRLWWSGPEEN